MAGIDVNFVVFVSSNRGLLEARSPAAGGPALALALTIFLSNYEGNMDIGRWWMSMRKINSNSDICTGAKT